MNKQEIFDGLCLITKEKHNACKVEAETIGRDLPTERGVLQLKVGIYNVATAAALLAGGDHAIEIMSKRFCNLVRNFPELASYYQSLSNDEKDIMAVSLYPEVFMRSNFYNTYNTDLAESEKEGDPQKIFKARIKKEVLDEILEMWRNFRVKNDLFVFAFEEYPIKVSNGKVIGESIFFLLANDSLGKECKRLCDFTDTLDKDSKQKKKNITEYKCAKYRYAAVSLIHSALQMNNRHRSQCDIEHSHFILVPFDNIFTSRAEYMSLYESAPLNEKPDYSLYYAMLAFAEKELSELEEKLVDATDWEKVEIEERIDGLNFAKVCLDEAWQKRKDVVK